jgi:hypothetical protein
MAEREREGSQSRHPHARKIIALLALAFTLFVGGGVAAAYYTLTAVGSGTYPFTIPTPGGSLTVQVRVTCTGATSLQPGNSLTCTLVITNNTSVGANVTFVLVTLTTSTVTACPPSWFSTPLSVPGLAHHTIAPHRTLRTTFRITMLSSTTTQSGCWGKIATVDATLTSITPPETVSAHKQPTKTWEVISWRYSYVAAGLTPISYTVLLNTTDPICTVPASISLMTCVLKTVTTTPTHGATPGQSYSITVRANYSSWTILGYLAPATFPTG